MEANRLDDLVRFFEVNTTPDYRHNGKARDLLLSELRQGYRRPFIVKAVYRIGT